MTNRSGGGGFGDYEGELELDSPAPASTPQVEESAPSGTMAPERPAYGSAQPPSSRPPMRPTDRRELSEARDPSGVFGKVLLLVIVGAISFVGYYVYCRMKTSDRQVAFDGAVVDLRQGMLYLNKPVVRADVEKVLRGYASKAGITIEELQLTLEPLDENSSRKLNKIAQTALSIAAKMPRHRLPKCVVGFKAACMTKYGIFTKRWVSERYTWFDDMAEGACVR